MTIVLDTGALIALDRGRHDVWSQLRIAFKQGHLVRVPAGVIGQAWRNTNRQALLSRALQRCDEVVLDGPAARASGELCGQTATSDVIDASVAAAVANSSHYDNDVILLTSDLSDLKSLISALDTDARVVTV